MSINTRAPAIPAPEYLSDDEAQHFQTLVGRLTATQQVFVGCYLENGCDGEAAVRATGYSGDNFRQMLSCYLRKPHITRILELHGGRGRYTPIRIWEEGERLRKLQNRAKRGHSEQIVDYHAPSDTPASVILPDGSTGEILTKQQILAVLSLQASVTVEDLMEVERRMATGEPPGKFGMCIQEWQSSVDRNGVRRVRIKAVDRQKAIGELGRLQGWKAPKQNGNSSSPGAVNVFAAFLSSIDGQSTAPTGQLPASQRALPESG